MTCLYDQNMPALSGLARPGFAGEGLTESKSIPAFIGVTGMDQILPPPHLMNQVIIHVTAI
jgi:hypothetical protein